MSRYLDLIDLIDVQPLTTEVLKLVEDEDLAEEFRLRLDEEFFRNFLKDNCSRQDIEIIKKVMSDFDEVD